MQTLTHAQGRVTVTVTVGGACRGRGPASARSSASGSSRDQGLSSRVWPKAAQAEHDRSGEDADAPANQAYGGAGAAGMRVLGGQERRGGHGR